MVGKHVMSFVTNRVNSNVDTMIYFLEKVLRNIVFLASAPKPGKEMQWSGRFKFIKSTHT
jgi:hypothetical protein